MQYHEFIGQVQNRARLGSEGEAVNAVRATLMTLRERLRGNEPLDVASQLPRPIQEFLSEGRAAGEGEQFSLDEFFQRVSNREGVDLPDATYHTRVVLEVLREAISPGEWEDMRAQLPPEFDRLLTAGSQGNMAQGNWQQTGGQ